MTENPEKENSNNIENDEEYVGRDWKKIFIGILFIFLATITWYIIQAIIGN